ncbi:hypothetical protein JCM19232_1768 [Vibrio ishigakensis]|uniref:Uncharacterized protein n=1 Tax=Vibrio ishigakensis TaxID=1481914 RepID=A0A0B8P8G6_9VIBR|nr:hypothetical protein JCM19232_1768 [Vibrio ishigakensis]GAM67722.1 hypothetical protein JCM19236_4648 [Vibrio sp. JCM 19236]
MCDKALHYAMLSQAQEVDGKLATQASQDILSFQAPSLQSQQQQVKKSAFRPAVLALLLASVGVGFTAMSAWQQMHRVEVENSQLAEQRQQQLEANKAISQKVQAQDNQLNALIERSRSPMGAMQSLYALWGYQASIVNSDCQSGTRAPFHCYRAMPL